MEYANIYIVVIYKVNNQILMGKCITYVLYTFGVR
jgi:hypothetical protein